MLKIRPVSWSIVNFTVSNPEIESLLSLKEDIWQFLTNSISVTSSDFKQEDNTNAKQPVINSTNLFFIKNISLSHIKAQK